MFEAQFEEAETFKRIIEGVKDIVNDTNLEISPRGLFMQALDPSHVAMVELKIRATDFYIYNCKSSCTIGINIPSLYKILKFAHSNCSLILCFSDLAPNKLVLNFQAKDHSKFTEFHLNLFSVETEHLASPEIEWVSEIRLHSSEFTKICKELEHISESVRISVKSRASALHHRNSVVFSVDGELGSGDIEVAVNDYAEGEEASEETKRENQEEGSVVQGVFEEELKASFALRYLNMIAKGSVVSNYVFLNFAHHGPMKVVFYFGKHGKLEFYLAPKIEDGQSEAS